jgi:hypothetical protein
VVPSALSFRAKHVVCSREIFRICDQCLVISDVLNTMKKILRQAYFVRPDLSALSCAEAGGQNDTTRPSINEARGDPSVAALPQG